MSYQVTFANVDLHDYCTILGVKRSVLPPRENYSKEIPTMWGSFYTGFKYGVREITLTVGIVAISSEDLANKIRDLAQALDVKSPSILEISDEPNLYHYAVVDGETSFERKFNTAKFDIKFLCHDPIIYSKDWKCFLPDEHNIITLENEGSIDTDLTVDVEFNNNACFFQVTNADGETVLIGEPKDATKTSIPLKEIAVNDNCEASSTFTALPQSLLLDYRLTNGEFGVGNNGNGIVCTNYGGTEASKWNGTGFKREIGADIDEFEVTIDFVFSSQGDNYRPPKPQSQPQHSNPSTPPSTTKSYGKYKVTARSGLWIEKEPNSKSSSHLHVMARNEIVEPFEVKGNWFKHTKKYKNGKSYTGWSNKKYLAKVREKKKITKKSTKKSTKAFSFGTNNYGINSFGADGTERKYPENQLGLLEIYGYDKNGGQMFKMEVADRNAYYENVVPKIFVGDRAIVQDTTKVPAPKTIKKKDSNGKVETKSIASGAYGSWNDLQGKFILRREKIKEGQYKWSGIVNKYKNGKIIKTMKTKNAITDSKFSKAGLNHLGFYIGAYADNPTIDMIAINNIRVKVLNYNKIKKLATKNNVQVFKKGDHLQINFDTGSVTINDVEELSLIDIGSQFFDIETGTSEIAVRTDDKEADIMVGFQERYI